MPGETVEVAADPRTLLRAASMLYLPALAGVILAPASLRVLGLDAGVLTLPAAGLGLFGGLLLARRWTSTLPPVVVRRLP